MVPYSPSFLRQEDKSTAIFERDQGKASGKNSLIRQKNNNNNDDNKGPGGPESQRPARLLQAHDKGAFQPQSTLGTQALRAHRFRRGKEETRARMQERNRAPGASSTFQWLPARPSSGVQGPWEAFSRSGAGRVYSLPEKPLCSGVTGTSNPVGIRQTRDRKQSYGDFPSSTSAMTGPDLSHPGLGTQGDTLVLGRGGLRGPHWVLWQREDRERGVKK